MEIIEFENYLLYLEKYPEMINGEEISMLMGEALGCNNNPIVSMLNNLVRNYNINTTKKGIMYGYHNSFKIREKNYFLALIFGKWPEFSGEYTYPEVYHNLETKSHQNQMIQNLLEVL